ncbi:MAG TPA: NAD-dependent epimerase/dehydratase family protein [Actinomycetota bacterium]|nr:NAD-dependent epimerase/dehydratase family protein [Actinomycetota bacterium]
MTNKYLITGGAGFIGSHLADVLTANFGCEVVALDNLSTGRQANLVPLVDRDSFRFVRGSIFDEELVRKLVGDVDVVVHLAASVGVQLIVKRPLETLLNNIRGTEIVLEVCADESRKVLVASTSEIYGKNASGPLHEDADRILGSPLKSRWSYSTSKAVDEILAHAYWRERQTPAVIVRLFNTVGPRQTGDYGMVVPRLVGQALRGEPLSVFGTGEQRRSFCHVLDTVAALVALLNEDAAVGEVFNIGSPAEITINDLARTIVEMTGSPSPIEHVPYDVAYEVGFEDMERRVPDISKISALTGWMPTRSLPQILEDVIEFERASRADR